uniref:EOG090X0JQ4 n=1 Tax=Lynceus sp. MCZ IZ 141354 TaxID=1930659 RepID=A0A9N6ZEW0_9CRUS|nr:EOG090X0JQ4 [Lynceus sp. MCZ IZ 141354]
MSSRDSTLCKVCSKQDGKYTCSKCFLKSCSLDCYKTHKQSLCEKVSEEVQQKREEEKQAELAAQVDTNYSYPTEDTVPREKLERLGLDEKVKECLYNPHLRKLLASLVAAGDPSKAMENALQEPLFTEFANACLASVQGEPEA